MDGIFLPIDVERITFIPLANVNTPDFEAWLPH